MGTSVTSPGIGKRKMYASVKQCDLISRRIECFLLRFYYYCRGLLETFAPIPSFSAVSYAAAIGDPAGFGLVFFNQAEKTSPSAGGGDIDFEKLKKLPPDKLVNAVYQLLITHRNHLKLLCLGAKAFSQMGDLREAERIYRAAMEMYPAAPEPRRGLAAVLGKMGRFPEAEALCQGREDNATRIVLAGLLAKQRKYPAAERLYRRILAASDIDQDDRVVARNGLAGVLAKRKQFNAARALCLETIKMSPSDTYARNALASIFLQEGNSDFAESAYRNTITLFPDNPTARVGLAGILALNRGCQTEAETLYRDALALDPFEVRAYNGLARLYEQQARPVEAEKNYQKAIELFSYDKHAYNALARMWAGQGRCSEALGIINQIVGEQGLDPYDIYSRMIKAMLLLSQPEGTSQQAHAVLMEAIEARGYLNEDLRRIRAGLQKWQLGTELLETFETAIFSRKGRVEEAFRRDIRALLFAVFQALKPLFAEPCCQ